MVCMSKTLRRLQMRARMTAPDMLAHNLTGKYGTAEATRHESQRWEIYPNADFWTELLSPTKGQRRFDAAWVSEVQEIANKDGLLIDNSALKPAWEDAFASFVHTVWPGLKVNISGYRGRVNLYVTGPYTEPSGEHQHRASIFIASVFLEVPRELRRLATSELKGLRRAHEFLYLVTSTSK